MKMKKRNTRLVMAAGVAVVSALMLAAVPGLAGASGPNARDPYLAADTHLNNPATIGGGGSSFAAPLENAAQALYQARTANASLNGYQSIGSGAGEADLIKKLVDFGGTDVPLMQSDIKKDQPSGSNYQLSQFLQIPVGLGGEAMVYNIPGFGGGTHLVLSAGVIAQIYEGKITHWNNSQIKALNKSVKLPSNKIVVVARADSSGTTYIFTDFLHIAAPKVWKSAPSKTPPTLPVGGLAGPQNAGVASDVENTPYSIGYVEYSYVLLNPSLLKGVAAVVNRAGKAVLPTQAGIALAAAARPHVSSTIFAIVFEGGKKTYPIAGYTWAVIWQKCQSNNNECTLLVKYLDWLSHSGTSNGAIAGQDVAALQGYVSLPPAIQALARSTLLEARGTNGKVLLTTNGG